MAGDKTIDPKQVRRDAEAKLKAERKAAKERKRNSTDPKDMGRVKQIVQAFKLTKEQDPALVWLTAVAVGVPIIAGVVVGILLGRWIMLPLTGIMVGLLLAMIILVVRARRATYKRYAGQPGSAEVALNMLPKTWTSAPAITANKQMDVVHRTLGPGGLILIGEGEPGRTKHLLDSEARKHQRITDRIEVVTLQMGDKEGQIPLDRLEKHIRKMPKVLQAYEITEIKQRLRALDAVRPRLPMPKGPMPTNPRQMRGARQAMRGR